MDIKKGVKFSKTHKWTFSASEKLFVSLYKLVWGEKNIWGFKAAVGVHVFFFFSFFCLYAFAPPVVALSLFDAQLHDYKMWAMAMSHFLVDDVWHWWCCMYGSVCASWFVCRCLHSGAACLLWSVIYVGVGIWGLLYTSVNWRVCVWVHSYVCIFSKIVFRHVTHSTFYACGVICNACWVHKGDYVNV